MIGDNQRTSVVEAMRAVSESVPAEESPRATAISACLRAGVSPEIKIGSALRVTRRRLELPEDATIVTVCHGVAHVATPSVFPPHGAEFCALLLDLIERPGLLSGRPDVAARLRTELDLRGAHYTPDHRCRAVLKAVTQRATDGTSVVEAVADDPPVSVTGKMLFRKSADEIVVGDSVLPLTRLRYLAKVR